MTLEPTINDLYEHLRFEMTRMFGNSDQWSDDYADRLRDYMSLLQQYMTVSSVATFDGIEALQMDFNSNRQARDFIHTLSFKFFSKLDNPQLCLDRLIDNILFSLNVADRQCHDPQYRLTPDTVVERFVDQERLHLVLKNNRWMVISIMLMDLVDFTKTPKAQ